MSSTSPPQSGTTSPKKSPPKGSQVKVVKPVDVVEWSTTPEFIYGGPFIKQKVVDSFLDTGTPRNVQLQGTYKKSYAYYSLKERLPVILTKVIDYLSRASAKIKSTYDASDEDIRSYIQYITKLKNDLVTNKKYDPLTVDTDDARKWNKWIEAQEHPSYFTNTWVFTECYVYRRLREGCELSKGLRKFDPFDEQKETAFASCLEPMCIVADRLVTMLPPSAKDKRKADFQTLLKLCLWANKCDLSLTAGSQVNIAGQKVSEADAARPLDPFQMIIDFKDKLLVDDTAKIADSVVAKAEAMAKSVAANTVFKAKCSCHRLATLAGMPILKEPEPNASPEAPPPEAEAKPEEEKKIPCPAKMTVPQTVMFDIICDNAGYELFADLCLAHFLISQNIVKKIRFHVKNIPWFVSDVTRRDFRYVIDACKEATYSRSVPSTEPTTDGGDNSRTITADNLRSLGEQWARYVEDGTFQLMAEDFWTYPHVYKDMKQVDYNLYRKLQLGCALLFKGDLNYRKLLGEKNWNPYTAFDPALQGFNPAPVIAVRTVKADLICGLPKGKFEQLEKADGKWMETGDYGVIQYSVKGEALKPPDKPCVDYGATCFGTVCPTHTDM